MRHCLIAHPGAPAPAVKSIEVEAVRASANRLVLRYLLSGDIPDLAIPPPAMPVRRDELWKQLCFEAFVGLAGSESYFEFNFSPSGAWAAYGFDSYRLGMRDIEMEMPKIEVATSGETLDLQAELEIEVPDDLPWQLNLTAVIERRNGERSYWALAHPDGPPNFHDRHCFVLELPSPSGT